MSSAVVAGASFLAGCEDGPNQPYTPATGTLFNNGSPDASADPGSTPLDGGYAGRTVLNICTDDLKRQRWAKMINEPIVPPIKFAGLDLRGDDTWRGLTVEEATLAPDPTTLEGGNCQGVATGIGGCGEQQSYSCGNIYWGDAQEVTFSYLQSLHIIDQLQLNLGYLGQMTAKSRDGAHTYTLQLGLPLMKDGQPFLIDWSSVGAADPGITEFYNAMMNTFAADVGIPFPADEDSCTSTGHCLNTGPNGGDGIFGIRPMGFYVQFHSLIAQPGQSTPYNIYVDYIKTTPASTLPMELSLSLGGPIAQGTVGYIGDAGGKPCVQSIGMTYGDFLNNCIAPYDDTDPTGANLNKVNKNKLVGARTHDFENIQFDVVGVNGDFTHTPELSDTQVVQDTDVPADTDPLTDWFFDVRAYGAVKNDANSHAKGAGTGLVAREYQRLVENDLAHLVGKLPSAPGTCLGPSFQPVDANHVCTGMETMAIPGIDATTKLAVVYPGDTPEAQAFMDFSGGNAIFAGGYLGSVLKPRDHYALFCRDPGELNRWIAANIGAGDCSYLSWWFATYQWVTRVMGQGDIDKLPLDARDRRYYYYWFGVAMTKYLKAYGALLDAGKDPTDPTVLTPDVVAAQPIDLETLFFDNQQGGTFDTFEYIDLESIVTNPPAGKEFLKVPLDYAYGNDVLGGNQRFTNYYRRLDREENALYQALAEAKSAPPAINANHGVNLTNMFGSPVLVNAYVNDPSFPTSYQCNIEMWAPTTPAAAPAGLCTLDPVKGTYSCPLCQDLGGGMFTCPQTPADYAGGPKCDGTTGTAGVCCGSPPPKLDTNGATLMDRNGEIAAYDTKGHYQAAVDGHAHPWLWQYPAVWGGNTIFSRGHSPIQVQKTDRNLEGATVVVPNFKNPWGACATKQVDSTGATTCDPADPTYASAIGPFIMPWDPPELESGFTIPVNGSSDKDIRTPGLLFEGQLETYTVDYQPWKDSAQPSCEFNGGTCNAGFNCVNKVCVASDNSIQILAIESHDFLGEVFLCQDQDTGDVLSARMYEPAPTILDWIANHPGVPLNGVPSASDNCNIIVRYSAFNNYPDFITSLANGVKVNINPGQGLGRVVDATLFDPIVETF
jgi:hypothetical protein